MSTKAFADDAGQSRAPASNPPADHVSLELPAQPEWWALARISASAIATRLDFGVDAVEDLRLAIDELCNSCAVGAGADSRLELDYRVDDEGLHVTCAVSPIGSVLVDDPATNASLELSGRILDALVDAHAIEEVKDRRRRGWLSMRRPGGT